MARRIEIPIEGMTCEHCARTVRDALTSVSGVSRADVSLGEKRAVLELANGAPSRAELAAAVARAGYRVPDAGMTPPAIPAAVPAVHARSKASPDRELMLDISGMTCASCVSRVEAALAAVPGVESARVNLATDQARVQLNADNLPAGVLIEAVKRSGYGARLTDMASSQGQEGRDRSATELSDWRRRLAVGVALLIPIVAMHFVVATSALNWVQFALATALQLYLGRPFLFGAARRARYLSANMDTLVALGTSAAYFAGVYGLFSAAHHAGDASQMYLMDAGTILTFITLGKYLEARAKGRASAAIRKLLDLAPPMATVERDGQSISMPPTQVEPGETIVVRPGEKVPLDAQVISGTSSVDESWLTGESMPVDKGPQSEILAGTINGQGSLTARVVRPAGQTALAQVIELVRGAQESKTDVQRLADRVVAWFVPVVLLIAIVTLLSWGLLASDWSNGLSATVAVLVVACPCALGLATPTAILVASGRGAELGILVKDAHALEIAARITTVVLDKTGTITLGTPRVTRVIPAAGVSEHDLLATAAAVERLSGHPLAKALVQEAAERGAKGEPASDLEVIAGQGVRAHAGDQVLLAGNEQLLATGGVALNRQAPDLEPLRAEGQTALLFARNTKYLGAIALSDTVSVHSREAVDRIKGLGLKVVLLSGDHRSVAEGVASEVGIAEVIAEVRPEQKHALVTERRAAGEVVAMVGDGINDAPALVAADLGIAIGSGSDVAIEAADVVIVGDDLRAVPRTIILARQTLRTIRQNLWWAFAYNVVLIPIAAGALVPLGGFRLPAVAAAVAMALSSVSVVTNSLLLRAKRIV